MKYLIPTNFSKESDAAIDLATKMAKENNAELHILHCQDCINDSIDRYHSKYDKPVYDELQIESAQIQLNKIQNKLETLGIKCFIYNECEKYERCIVDYSVNLNPDIIVIGAKSYKSTSDWLFHSTSKNVVKKINPKVIIVDEEISEPDFAKALMVIDCDKNCKNNIMNSINWLGVIGLKEIDIVGNTQTKECVELVANSINSGIPNVVCKRIIISEEDDFNNEVYQLMSERNYSLVTLKISDKPTVFSKLSIHDILSHSKQTALLAI